jgi:hypothetical protein
MLSHENDRSGIQCDRSMRRTLPSFLFNPSCLETQSSQIGSSDITTRTLLALLSDFLAERRTELLESREEHIRVKQMKTAQLTINSRVTALEAQQREVTTCQTVLSDDFVVLNDRQNEIAKCHTRIESVLSTVNEDISDLQAVLKSINRSDQDESEFMTELQSLHSESESVHDLLSKRADSAEERLIRLSAVAESVSYSVTTASQSISELNDTIRAIDAITAAQEFVSSRLNQFETSLSRISSEVEALQTSQSQSQMMPSRSVLSLDSQIVSDFPQLFEEFVGKRFSILWRGSRDGFSVNEFHRHCDGHANTLTLILDTNGNIFGGFTPMKWDSSNSSKCDDNQKSFLFTLKNQHSIPARKFVLKSEKKQYAIYCHSSCGPRFGGGCDICVSDNCAANTSSHTANFGHTYVNDSGVDLRDSNGYSIFLTGLSIST